MTDESYLEGGALCVLIVFVVERCCLGLGVSRRLRAARSYLSAAFFLNPKYETDVVPLSKTNQRFRSLNWGDFRSKRSAGDYADLGEEIQIDHFRV